MLKTVIIGSERKVDFYEHLLGDHAQFSMMGFYDPDDSRNYDATGTPLHIDSLMQVGEVFIIDRHIKHLNAQLIEQSIRYGKHLLFDGFPVFQDDLLYGLNRYSEEASSTIQVANVLHNKPLFSTALQYMRQVRLIKIEKYSTAPLPGQFEIWFQRTVAQEIDVALRIVNSGIRKITTRPVFLFGDQPDLLNIQIEFDNDAICTVAVGRALEPGINSFRVYQRDRYYHIDIAESRILEHRQSSENGQLAIPGTEHPIEEQALVALEKPVMLFDPWKMELRNFHENIEKNLTPLTALEDIKAIAALTRKVSETISRRYFAA